MRGNNVEETVADYMVSALVQLSGLRSLELDLSMNNLSDHGLTMLGGLHNQATLDGIGSGKERKRMACTQPSLPRISISVNGEQHGAWVVLSGATDGSDRDIRSTDRDVREHIPPCKHCEWQARMT